MYFEKRCGMQTQASPLHKLECTMMKSWGDRLASRDRRFRPNPTAMQALQGNKTTRKYMHFFY
jgi:hypothetical protein